MSDVEPYPTSIPTAKEREINNGRLVQCNHSFCCLLRSRFAMFAAIGIIAAELYTGKDAIEQFGL